MKYRALSTQPSTVPSGETQRTPEGEIRWHKVWWWKQFGECNSLEEAKAKWGGSPVLQEMAGLH